MSAHAAHLLAAKGAHLPTTGGGSVRSDSGSADGHRGSVRNNPGSADGRPGSVRGNPGSDGRPGSAHDQPGSVNGQSGSVRSEPGSAQDRPGSRHGESGSVNGNHFRSVLGRFATGVVAITAIDPETGEPCGLTANSFTSVSLDPPLVAFCVAHTSTSWPRVKAAKTQCVNVLAEHQRQVCAQLAARGGDKFAGLSWTLSPQGNPVIDGTLAWIECSPEAEHVAGDHVIVVARVHQLDNHDDHGPLLFFQGGYGGFQP